MAGGDRLKIECPVCGIQGFLEIRGKSARVKHYVGIKNGKRAYKTHRIDTSLIPRDLLAIKNKVLIPIDYQGITNLNLVSVSENKRGRRLAWSRL